MDQVSKARILIEVCVDSLYSAQAAIAGGADRLEVCGNLAVGGGTTPSSGLVKRIKQEFPDIPLMAMVRPRAGDFLYSDSDIEVMEEDIKQFKIVGASGVVFGVLTPDGAVDQEKTGRLANFAKYCGLQVCFHRAFDMTANLHSSASSGLSQLMELRKAGALTRILTSGGGNSASASLGTLQTLARICSDSPACILPGAGINARTARAVLESLLPFGVREIHLSGGVWVQPEGGMRFRRQGMGMGACGEGEWGVWMTSEENIRQVRRIADDTWEAYEATASKQ